MSAPPSVVELLTNVRDLARAYTVEVEKKGKYMNQQTKGPSASVGLDSPGIMLGNVTLGRNIQVRRSQFESTGTYNTVTNFHTHPLSDRVQGDPQPFRADMANAYARGLPDIVISRDRVCSYGPERRTGEHEQSERPVPALGIPAARLERHHPPPMTVDNQWPEGASDGFAQSAQPI